MHAPGSGWGHSRGSVGCSAGFRLPRTAGAPPTRPTSHLAGVLQHPTLPAHTPQPPHLEVLGVLLLVVGALVVQVGGGVGQVAQEPHRAGQRLLGRALRVGWGRGDGNHCCVPNGSQQVTCCMCQSGLLCGATTAAQPQPPPQAPAPHPGSQGPIPTCGVLAGGSSAWLRDTSMPAARQLRTFFPGANRAMMAHLILRLLTLPKRKIQSSMSTHQTRSRWPPETAAGRGWP